MESPKLSMEFTLSRKIFCPLEFAYQTIANNTSIAYTYYLTINDYSCCFFLYIRFVANSGEKLRKVPKRGEKRRNEAKRGTTVPYAALISRTNGAVTINRQYAERY